MLKGPIGWRIVVIACVLTLVLGIGIGLVLSVTVLARHTTPASPGTASSNTTPPTPTPSSAPFVTIPQSQEIFEPFILVVQPNTTVTWQNEDNVAHTFGTTWDHSSFLNPQAFSLTIAAGHRATFSFTQPGVYDYFDTTESSWDKTDHRVTAKKGSPNFPLAMEAIIWVQGPISGLPSSATNSIPNGKDGFSADFLAVRQGGTVSWHNFDTDTHFIGLVAGWTAPINPNDIGVHEVKGTTDVPHGQIITLSVKTPGLYY
jgi:plastocyanin